MIPIQFKPVIDELVVNMSEIPNSILCPAYEIIQKERMEATW